MVLVFEDFDFAVDYAGSDEIEFFGGPFGDVNDSALDVWPAVGDFNHNGLAVTLIGDAHFGAHGQGFVGRCHGMVLERNATRGMGPSVALDFIPRCLAVLGLEHFGFFVFIRCGLVCFSDAGRQKHQGGGAEK